MSVADDVAAFLDEAARLRREGAFESITVTFNGGFGMVNPTMRKILIPHVTGEDQGVVVTVPFKAQP